MREKRNIIKDYYLVFHQENKYNKGMIENNLINYFLSNHKSFNSQKWIDVIKKIV